MEINPQDVRVDHFYLGPGKGSSVKAVHLPTGITVAETVSPDSSEPGHMITGRLLSALKTKLQEKNPSAKS
jgi:hypothetical protein